MGKHASIGIACTLCVLSLVLISVPARADHIDPITTAVGFLGIFIVAVAICVGAFLLIFKRKR